MVEIYKTDNKVLQKLDNIEEGCWVNMIDPTSSELSLVSGYFEIDLADLATALDEEESSRISLEDGYTLILVDIPTPEVRHEKKMYTTIPLGIILKNDATTTNSTTAPSIILIIPDISNLHFFYKYFYNIIFQILPCLSYQ